MDEVQGQSSVISNRVKTQSCSSFWSGSCWFRWFCCSSSSWLPPCWRLAKAMIIYCICSIWNLFRLRNNQTLKFLDCSWKKCWRCLALYGSANRGTKRLNWSIPRSGSWKLEKTKSCLGHFSQTERFGVFCCTRNFLSMLHYFYWWWCNRWHKKSNLHHQWPITTDQFDNAIRHLRPMRSRWHVYLTSFRLRNHRNARVHTRDSTVRGVFVTQTSGHEKTSGIYLFIRIRVYKRSKV